MKNTNINEETKLNNEEVVETVETENIEDKGDNKMKKERKVSKKTKFARKGTGTMFRSAVVNLIGMCTLGIFVLVGVILLISAGVKVRDNETNNTEITTKETIIEKEVPVEVIVEKEIEVEKEVKVVDEDEVNKRANEIAQQMIDEAVANAIEEYEATHQPETIEVEVIRNVVDEDEINRRANEQAQQLIDEYVQNNEVNNNEEIERLANEKAQELIDDAVTNAVNEYAETHQPEVVTEIVEVVDEEEVERLANEIAQQIADEIIAEFYAKLPRLEVKVTDVETQTTEWILIDGILGKTVNLYELRDIVAALYPERTVNLVATKEKCDTTNITFTEGTQHIKTSVAWFTLN